MPVFATVTEGASDHAVLENILLGFCKGYDVESGDVRQVQPPVDRTGRQLATSQGGWEMVLYWLREKSYHDAFQVVDHVIIQIDTDVCDNPAYGVSRTTNNIALSTAELVSAVKAMLERIIGEQDLSLYNGRFHFAISVNAIECWMLPLWGRPYEYQRTNSCKRKLDNALARNNQAGLRKDHVSTYQNASARFRKRSDLSSSALHQESLAIFLSSLETVCPSVAA